MPVISCFYGIIISMFFEGEAEHHIPHFHARYAGSKASVNFDGDILAGYLPPKQALYVKTWATIHRDELDANWELALMKETLCKIDPLR